MPLFNQSQISLIQRVKKKVFVIFVLPKKLGLVCNVTLVVNNRGQRFPVDLNQFFM